MNYETVKAFNNEKLERNRYQELLDNLKKCAVAVQKSLSELNTGQAVIYTTGLTVNLMMAAHGVSNGTMSPGDFILLQAYFLQLAGPLFNMGTFFRSVEQSKVDVEDLFDMLQREPKVTESPDAVDFVFKNGNIEFKGIGFGHEVK